jgi:ribosomal subunit interface protein
MERALELKGWTPLPVERDLLEKMILQLDRRVARLRLQTATLRALVEKNDARTLYRVSLTLELPGRMLVAHEERRDIAEAAREAFVELERQLARYEERRRNDDSYKRPERRAKLRALKMSPSAKG